MSVLSEAKLELRSLVPAFHLMSSDGLCINVWDFKGKQNLLLVFVHGNGCSKCVDFLEQIAGSYADYEDDETVVLAIVRGGQEAAAGICAQFCSPFPILYDSTGSITDSYTNTLPAVFAADRYGELRAQWMIGPDEIFPSQTDILDVVELANLECPECGT
ncbi:MAG TPA: redoxin domain-containing protein [Armatimonadota bacterium]|jgi:peroxiredoxin